MALENVDAVEGWRKLLGMLNAEKGAYALYVLMKIVLSVGSAILFTIVNIIVLLILLIPLAAVGVAAFFIGKGAGMTWDISTILLVAGFGLLAIAGILCAMGFVYSPGLVFFQSYTLEFFAARYAPLASRMFPSSAPTQPPITPLPTGESFPPPEPSSA
jgi:hypothetical protein